MLPVGKSKFVIHMLSFVSFVMDLRNPFGVLYWCYDMCFIQMNRRMIMSNRRTIRQCKLWLMSGIFKHAIYLSILVAISESTSWLQFNLIICFEMMEKSISNPINLLINISTSVNRWILFGLFTMIVFN